MRIGLLGFGVVGKGLYDLAQARPDMEVVKVLCLEDIQQNQERIWTAAEQIVSALAALK